MPAIEFARLLKSDPTIRRQVASRHSIAKHFGSLGEYCTPPAMMPDNYLRALNELQTEGRTWHGIEGGADAVLHAVQDGWQDGVQRLEAAFGQIAASLPTPTTTKRRRVWADAGDSYDPHRAMSGSLDRSWRTTRRERQQQRDRRVTIVFNSAASFNVTGEQLFWRGAAALALVDALSGAGYVVELIAGNAASGCDKRGDAGRSQWTATLVSPGQPVDLNNLAAALCLAGVFRTFGFAHMEALPFPLSDYLGHPAEIDLKRLDGVSPEAVYVGNYSGVDTKEGATAFVRHTLARLTGEDL